MKQFKFFSNDPLRDRFEEFHRDNPHVYEWMREKALALKARGWEHYSIWGLYQAFRFHTALETTDPDFKLNNNYTPYYSRLLMQKEPRLRGFFETRTAKADR